MSTLWAVILSVCNGKHSMVGWGGGGGRGGGKPHIFKFSDGLIFTFQNLPTGEVLVSPFKNL